LQVLANPGQLLGSLLLQLAIQQLLLGILQVLGRLIQGFSHMLAEAGQRLEQQAVEGGVGGGLSIAHLTQHQQGQFTGDGATLHQ
jgi:hypothetical protein